MFSLVWSISHQTKLGNGDPSSAYSRNETLRSRETRTLPFCPSKQRKTQKAQHNSAVPVHAAWAHQRSTEHPNPCLVVERHSICIALLVTSSSGIYSCLIEHHPTLTGTSMFVTGVNIPIIHVSIPSGTSFPSLLFGNLINMFLYGVLTVQLYLYYNLYYISFPQDPWLLKTIVYLIYLTETGHSILLIYDFGNHLTFSDVGGTAAVSVTISDPQAIQDTIISLVVIPVCGGIVAFLTQATYVYRLRILSQLRYISWSIVAFIVANLVFFIIMASLGLTTLPSYVLVFQVWASVSLAIDTTIAGIMIWSLTKNKILSKQLKFKVIHLVYLIIGTGALTATINLGILILFVFVPPVALGPAIVLSKIYANSMMVFLNDRIPYGHDGSGQAISLEMMTGSLHPNHLATLPGPADAAQGQLALETNLPEGVLSPERAAKQLLEAAEEDCIF